MTPLQFAARQRGIRRRLMTTVRRLFALRGAPATDGQRIDLALELFRLVQRERVESYRFATAMLASEALRLDVDLRTRPMRRYDADALVKVLERATGVLPDAPLVEVRMLDPDTQRMARRRVAVTESNRRDPVVVRQVSERTSRTVVRHAQQAGREAVEDTANASGPIVGWARVLSGTENCAFCAMLASRGPVFRSEHAAKYKNIAGTDTYHDGCVVPGTWVSGPDTQVGYRRHYEGEIVTLVTAAGNELSITPKHPILTDSGWVAAGELNPGDQLVSASGSNRNVVSGPDVDHVPARIEDVVGALGVMDSSTWLSVPGTAEQFHGDGFDSEVDVVVADYLLREILDAAFAEPFPELDFHRAAMSPAVAIDGAFGERAELLHTFLGSSDSPLGGGMGGSGLSGAFVGSQFGCAHYTGLAAATNGYAEIAEPPMDYTAGDPVFGGESIDRFARLVSTGNVRGRSDLLCRPVGVARKFDPPTLDGSPEVFRIYAERGADLRKRLSTSVHLDRLVDKRVGVWQGDVLNLATREGWYNANSITVSNCDCQAVLVRKGVPWLGSKESERLSELWASSTRGKRGKVAVAAFSKAWRADQAREKESAQVAA